MVFTKENRLSLSFIIVLTLLMVAGCGNEDSAEYDTKTPVAEQVNYKIQGIDPGAGVMRLADEALDDYGLREAGWEVGEASDAAMTATIDAAYGKKEAVVVTAWSPHWMFQAYDLKFLEDPEGSFGEPDDLYTLVRLGLEQDDPIAYTFLDRFFWEAEHMEKVMIDTRETNSETAASAWIEENSEMVDEWVDGLDAQPGRTLRIGYVAWDSEIASSHVLKAVLEERLDYDVEMVLLDAVPMYAAVAGGDVDVTVSVSLPNTHRDHYERFGDQVDNLGINLEGMRLGLVVPQYMENINSVGDLLDK